MLRSTDWLFFAACVGRSFGTRYIANQAATKSRPAVKYAPCGQIAAYKRPPPAGPANIASWNRLVRIAIDLAYSEGGSNSAFSAARAGCKKLRHTPKTTIAE